MNTKIISGNFGIEIEGTIGNGTIDLSEERKGVPVADVIDEAGLTYIVQRDGLSSVYKDLLEKGAKRNTLDYSSETGAKFASALEKALAPYGDFVVSVEEHVPSEAGASPMVRATALVDGFLGTPMEAAYRQILGSPDGDRDALVALAHKQGLGIQPPRKPGTKKGE